MMKRRYKYRIERFDKHYRVDLENIINYATRYGERLVNVDYSPMEVLIILEEEVTDN